MSYISKLSWEWCLNMNLSWEKQKQHQWQSEQFTTIECWSNPDQCRKQQNMKQPNRQNRERPNKQSREQPNRTEQRTTKRIAAEQGLKRCQTDILCDMSNTEGPSFISSQSCYTFCICLNALCCTAIVTYQWRTSTAAECMTMIMKLILNNHAQEINTLINLIIFVTC